MAVALVGTAQEFQTRSSQGSNVRTVSNIQGSGGSLVVLIVSWRDTDGPPDGINITGVTYGGASPPSMTAINATKLWGSGGSLQAFYIITSSNGDAVITWSSEPTNGYVQATALVFSGTHATTPIGTTQTSDAQSGATSTATSAVTSSADGLCLDGFLLRTTVTGLTAGGDQTLRSDIDEDSSLFHRTSTEAGAASVTMSWSWTSPEAFTHIVMPLAPAPAGYAGILLEETPGTNPDSKIYMLYEAE